MATLDIDPDMYTKMTALTKSYRRDLYPALEAALSSASGKYVLITGASKGLGKVMALSWAKAGAAGIVICSRKAGSLESVTADIKAANSSTQVVALACDTTKPTDVAELFLAAKKTFGKLDVVIANVGLAGYGKMGEVDAETWWSEFTTNGRSPLNVADQYIRTFGPEPSGTFITMTSGVVSGVFPGISSYALSKYTCIQLVEYLDAEQPKLKAFALDPGIIKGVAAMPQFVPYAHDEPELLGAFSIWLASGKADKIKGGYVHITWDVDELEEGGDEIREKGLLKGKFLNGVLGQKGGALGK